MKRMLNRIPALLLTVALALPVAAADKTIYPAPEQAQADLQAALSQARHQHKRILLDFGGNWCGDCQVLDIYLHRPENLALLNSHFVLVHINIGHKDANLNLATRYGVPLDKGVPALAVLNERGTVLYSQKNGEFEAMRSMDPDSVKKFLVEWSNGAPCSTTYVNC